jgi:hypothetical protein
MDESTKSIGTREEYNKLLLMLQQKESTFAILIFHYADYIICIVG